MNKAELANIVAEENGLTKAAALRILDSTFSAMRQALSNGEEVVVPDFGKFLTETRAERDGRNPKTGATIKIPATQVVKFKVAKALKDLVQQTEIA
jgi:DNA-binding protein HU-beta